MFLTSKPLEISKARIESGLSLAALGEASGLNPTTIFNMEARPKRVTPRAAKAVSDALEVSMFHLFDLNEGGYRT